MNATTLLDLSCVSWLAREVVMWLLDCLISYPSLKLKYNITSIWLWSPLGVYNVFVTYLRIWELLMLLGECPPNHHLFCNGTTREGVSTLHPNIKRIQIYKFHSIEQENKFLGNKGHFLPFFFCRWAIIDTLVGYIYLWDLQFKRKKWSIKFWNKNLWPLQVGPSMCEI
jgi:hypothetical protein